MGDTTTGRLHYGASAEDLAGLTDRMVPDPTAVLPENIPAMPDPNEPLYVNMSIRMPVDVVDRIRAYAEKNGKKYTLVCREWLELMITDVEGRKLTHAELLRAIDVLRRLLDSDEGHQRATNVA